jgi:hypothetical protein
MYNPLPTVRVKSDATESGFMIINESDFDSEIHELFVESEEEKPRIKKVKVLSESQDEPEETVDLPEVSTTPAIKQGKGFLGILPNS